MNMTDITITIEGLGITFDTEYLLQTLKNNNYSITEQNDYPPKTQEINHNKTKPNITLIANHNPWPG